MAETDNFTPEQQLSRVAATIDQPDKFAKVFCEAAKTQKAIDEVLMGNIKILIKQDKETREYIKGIIRELEKEDVWLVFKKFGFFGWTLIVSLLSAIVGAIAKGHIAP